MDKYDFFERLLASYSGNFDIDQPFETNGEKYDAYAEFNVTSAKYVLSKKAELWRAQCYEYVFFKVKNIIDVAEIENIKEQIVDFLEPNFVRKGENVPPPNHMYSFITIVYICDEDLSEDVKKMIKRFKYIKNYRFTVRGYCEVRFAVFDLKNKQIYCNNSAKDLVKGYKKIFKSFFV